RREARPDAGNVLGSRPRPAAAPQMRLRRKGAAQSGESVSDAAPLRGTGPHARACRQGGVPGYPPVLTFRTDYHECPIVSRSPDAATPKSGADPPAPIPHSASLHAGYHETQRKSSMLKIFRESESTRDTSATELPPGVIWIDLLNPTDGEKALVESRTRVRIPTIEALSEIESSSRLAVDHEVVHLSVPAVAQGDTADAYASPTGFILTRSVLITVRFAPLSVFDSVAEQVKRDETLRSAAGVFTALLEAMVDRGADVLERLGAELTKVSRSVFRGDPARPKHPVR